MSINFDELFDVSISSPSEENLRKLRAALGSAESPAEHGELLGMLFEAWAEGEDDGELAQHQADFTLQVLELRCGDNALFRKALNRAIKRLLPPYLNKPGLLRTLGINDANVSIHEVVRRFRNLLSVNANTLVFLRTTRRWGIVRNIDALAGTAAFVPLGTGSSNAIPVSVLLGDGAIFLLSPDSQRMAAVNRRVLNSGNEFRNIARTRALAPLSDEEIREIALLTLTPAIMNAEDFEKWWSKQDAPTAAAGPAKRGSWNARSLQEMALLLEAEGKEAHEVSGEMLEGYREFFIKLRPASIAQEGKQLANVVGLLTERIAGDELGEVLAPLAEKCGFLPAVPSEVPLASLTLYGELNVKTMSKLFDAFKLFLTPEYLAELAARMPLKALAALAEKLDDEVLFPALRDAFSSADIYMYIWRNRAKRTGKLLDLVNISNVVKVLNQAQLPKEWMVSVRELKNTLMDKADFQDYLLNAAERDVKRITGALQGALSLGSGERQSLLVKFARLDRNMQAHLESGAGSKLIAEAADAESAAKNAKQAEPMYSSVASIRKLKEELDNIINVEQPRNREALKTARAHGDFRENSEFDAAKERRNFLTRRRNELERILMQVQAVNFAIVKPEKHALIGCTVTLEYPNGETETHHLLGAWDGDPDKRYLSYKTRLGEAIYQHEVGATLDLPGGKRAVLKKIEPLSPKILEEMDK